MKTFRPYDPDQMLLMPPSLQEWVPEGHLAHFISDLVDTMDLSTIEGTYTEERGYPPYHPCMMVKLLVYAYCTGTYSSRRIAAKLTDSVAYRFLAAGNEPDYRTVSDFRKRHGEALAGLFDQVLRLCREAGLVKLGRVALDGIKIKANASKHKAMSYGRMKKQEDALVKEVRQMLQRAEAADRDEDERFGFDNRGDELPAELARRESRLKKIREAKAALEREAREKAKTEGRDPDDTEPKDKDQRNFTDPESKIQKTGDGFIQGYNAQVAVDGEFQVIVSQHVTPTAPDTNEWKPSVERIEKSLGCRPEAMLADAGYWSEDNAQLLETKRIEGYIATRRMKHGETEPPPRGRPAKSLTPRDRMARKLRTLKGRRAYAKRKAIVEPVIGQIKQARGFRQFLRRGKQKVAQEWALVCTAHNILKLFTAMKLA
ncbi:MAG TPA: IS1182 family transposase [Candidatus Polarisedimenticolia bacterium]|nr:IS1182 family transposase [Candidatus Polarisedimenticolia bacterium]